MSADTKLLRGLGPWMAGAIVVGTVIGSGVFKKPQSIAENVPNFGFVALVWIGGGILTVLGALALAEVAVLFPRAGGNYVFLREGLGRFAGFLWGWVEFWIIRSASIAALGTIFAESLHDVLRQTIAVPRGAPVLTFWEQRLITVAVLIALALVNCRGVRWGGGLQLVVTFIKVLSLAGILLLPFLLWTSWSSPVLESQSVQFSAGGLSTAFLGVLWAYHGWMNIAPVAEEVREPQRNLPRAFLGGVGVVVFLYLGANLAYHLVVPFDEMAQLKDTTVAADFFFRLIGPVGAVLASAAVMISVFGALNGNLLVGPRLLYAMGEDRLAPAPLAKLHPTFRTPVLATLVLTAWSIVLVLAGGLLTRLFPFDNSKWWIIGAPPPASKPLFDLLTEYAMFGAVIFETLAVAMIFVFRRRLPEAPRPYRCPLYPWAPLAYLLLPAYILANMVVEQTLEVATGAAFIGLGALAYVLWFGDAPERTSAALHV